VGNVTTASSRPDPQRLAGRELQRRMLGREWSATTNERRALGATAPAAAPFAAVPYASQSDGEQTEHAMMGFTFAPPAIEWGYRIQEEICIFGFCFEIFYARIGYEFDLALGLRLPIEVDLDDIPQSPVLAGEEVSLSTSIEPVDFTVEQYRAFCEQHDLDSDWFISDCERFAFPDLLDAMNPLIPAADKDGDELVAQYTVFAGIVVRLFSIPLINWAIDSSVDLPAICTLLKIKNELGGKTLLDLLEFGKDLAKDRDVIQAVKNQLANCGSFTTPYGFEPDPLNPLLDRLRAFPFTGEFPCGPTVRTRCARKSWSPSGARSGRCARA